MYGFMNSIIIFNFLVCSCGIIIMLNNASLFWKILTGFSYSFA